MFRTKKKFKPEKKVTHVIETIADQSFPLEIVRLSGPGQPKNFADEMLAELEKDNMGQFTFPQLFEKAYLNDQALHIADIVYHIKRNAFILTENPAEMIKLHKFILEYSEKCPELSKESNALFLEFVLNHAKTLTREKRYAFLENLLSLAIHAYDDEKPQPHPMQTIINHLYHYACGKRENQPVTTINLNETLSTVLIKQAQEKRQGIFIWLFSHYRSESKAETSEHSYNCNSCTLM